MNLFVGNLNPETTAASLRKLFSEFGEIVSSKVIIDNATGMSRGFGFVEMADKFHSYDAIDNLDAIFFEGSVISVKEAKGNAVKGGGSKGGGFKKPFKPRFPRSDDRPPRNDDRAPRSDAPPRRDDFNSFKY